PCADQERDRSLAQGRSRRRGEGRMIYRAWILAFALPLCAHAQSLQEIAPYQGADRQQRLIEGARKEGTLVYYTTYPGEYTNLLIEPFAKRYGVKVNVWRARSEIVLQRATAEARAGSPSADVITVFAPVTETLRREKLLQEIRSPYHADLAPSSV